MQKQYSRGFTLIEVMIVVVIVAILAAVALPSYQQYVERSRRVDATESLLRMATLQERFFFQNSAYTQDIDDLGGTTSPEGWYTLNLNTDNCTAVECGEFVITATPVKPGPQDGDTRCATFSIDQALRQTATGTDAARCW